MGYLPPSEPTKVYMGTVNRYIGDFGWEGAESDVVG